MSPPRSDHPITPQRPGGRFFPHPRIPEIRLTGSVVRPQAEDNNPVLDPALLGLGFESELLVQEEAVRALDVST